MVRVRIAVVILSSEMLKPYWFNLNHVTSNINITSTARYLFGFMWVSVVSGDGPIVEFCLHISPSLFVSERLCCL